MSFTVLPVEAPRLASNKAFPHLAGTTTSETRSRVRGEDVRELLEACGSSRSLQVISVEPGFNWEQLRDLRIAGGCENISGGERIVDYSLRGLDEVLATLSNCEPPARADKARLLWDAIGEVEVRRGAVVFNGVYEWSYYRSRSKRFDSTFVQQLNTRAWIPDIQGELQKPRDVMFEHLGWRSTPFLLSKILFKPPVIEMLAKEAGIEPGILDLLRKLGVTREADLRARLGVDEQVATDSCPDNVTTGVVVGDDGRTERAGLEDSSLGSPAVAEGAKNKPASNDIRHNFGMALQPNEASRLHADGSQTEQETRTFVSYIATHVNDEDELDPDGLDQKSRMELEEKAIQLILSRDPQLQRTSMHNRGFDLFEPDGSGHPVRWVEVKAMTDDLAGRPVCMSRAQFDCAWIQGEAYWLYIVERAGDGGLARVLRIQDPAGKAKHFSFDQGWRHIAESGAP